MALKCSLDYFVPSLILFQAFLSLQRTVSDSSFLLLPFQYLFPLLDVMYHLLVIVCSVHLLKFCSYIFLLFSQSSNYLLWIIYVLFSQY